MEQRGKEIELTPATFARLADVGLDRAVVGAWSLFELARHEHGEALVLELARGGESLSIEVGTGRGAVEVGKLAVSWRPGSTAAEAERLAVCRAVAERLRAALGGEPRSFAFPRGAPPLSELSEADELPPAELGDDPDAALLSRDFAQYERLFGERPRAVRASGGVSVFYPPPRKVPPPSGALRPLGARLRRRRFRRFLAGLGCAAQEGYIRTVPTPASFVRLCPGSPVVPQMVAGRLPLFSGRAWAESVLRGVLPVGVAPSWSLPVFGVTLRVPVLSRVPVDVGMLVHDISMHALAFHAIPREHWRALSDAARACPPEQAAAFFEGPLTRVCWELYDALEDPARFAGEFGGKMDELRAELRAVRA